MIDVADNNTIFYYHFDGLGSVVALSDATANVVEEYSYDVFGEPNTTSTIGNSLCSPAANTIPKLACTITVQEHTNPALADSCKQTRLVMQIPSICIPIAAIIRSIGLTHLGCVRMTTAFGKSCGTASILEPAMVKIRLITIWKT
ncbi:MAG: hypothetical protein A2Y12_19695 [Planctomycetes bacterium GWF2_42_9]|nr:MAG: hypothetical protein A2Y12_19695 [Planctomycetes bacterium GWF2_42_9]